MVIVLIFVEVAEAYFYFDILKQCDERTTFIITIKRNGVVTQYVFSQNLKYAVETCECSAEHLFGHS